MTQKEIKRLTVVYQVLDGVLSVKDAAEVLGLSTRQILRLKKGVHTKGPGFVIHKNKSRKPARTIPEKTKKLIAHHKKNKYPDANFTHFTELLLEHENISISRSSVHRILSSAGINSPKKHKRIKLHQRRKRKSKMGLLVQIDASPFKWLPGEDTTFSLHGAIDDATGAVLGLYLTKNECLDGYFQLMHRMLDTHGIPAQIYSDRHTIFFSPKHSKLSIEEQLAGKQVSLTQFGRAMQELEISMIPAKSPQAKGRIERLWGTLQSRLPTELKVAGINSLKAANEFLKGFPERFNQRFAVAPQSAEKAFSPVSKNLNLDYILCCKEHRVLDNSAVFSFQGDSYQLQKVGQYIPASRSKITVLHGPNIGLKALYQGQVFATTKLDIIPKKSSSSKSKSTKSKTVARSKPKNTHPWKNSSYKKTIFYDQSDRELLEGLFNSTHAWR